MIQSYLLVSYNTQWLKEKTLEQIGGNLVKPTWAAVETNPDTHIITSKKSIGIDEIREVTTILSRRPYQEKQSIIVIRDAALLTIPAQNAFLKLLEEPPAYAIILLWSEKLTSLIPTIRSRCFVIEEAHKKSTILSEDDIAFIKALQEASPGERLQKISAIGKDVIVVGEFLEKLILHYYLENLNTAIFAHNMIKLKAQLEKAISPKFILDMAALQIPNNIRK